MRKVLLHKILVGNPEGRDYLEDLGVDERIMLKNYERGREWWCKVDSTG
jgi:hypothetical protein